MKKYASRILPVLILCAALCAALLTLGAANPDADSVYTVDEPYVYPILPGTDEWLALDGLPEKIEACRVDVGLMESMTTPALLETVLTYPLLLNVRAYDTPEAGFASVSGYFEGLELLRAREDAAECLLEFVQTPGAVDKIPGAATSKIYALAWYLGVEVEALNAIMQPASVVSQLAAAMSAGKAIYTPNGSYVRASFAMTWSDHSFLGMGPTEETAKEEEVECFRNYPSMKKISDFSPAYNCHSYAWYRAAADNLYWINRENALVYMTDGSYTQRSYCLVGNKVFWTQDDHSAIVYNKVYPYSTVIYISKWGCSGVYTHTLQDCPYKGDVTYWTR